MRDFGSFGSGLNFVQYRGIIGCMSALHPGSKIIILVSGITTITLLSSVSALILLTSALFLAAGIHGLSPGKLLKPLVPILPFLLIVLLLQALSLPREAGEALLSKKDILPVTITGFRILTLMSLLGFVSALLTTSEISYGVEALLAPLGRLGIPAAELGLIATITFRFIPFLREESERLAKAQTARGGTLGHHSANPLRRMRASLPIMVPLFIGTLRKAEILAESMHLRGYSESSVRNRLHRYHIRSTDLLVLVLAALLAVGALILDLYQADRLVFTIFYGFYGG